MRDVELYRHLLGLSAPWTVRSGRMGLVIACSVPYLQAVVRDVGRRALLRNSAQW